MLRQEKGITLIALVITIIVLLILAGVTIAMLSGQDGILTRATGASMTNKLAEVEERIALKVTDGVTKYYQQYYVNQTATNPETLKDVAEAAITSVGEEYNNDDTITITTSQIKYEKGNNSKIRYITIDDHGKVEFKDTAPAAAPSGD